MKKCYNMPVVILAGGLGTRLREETQFRPKPMVPIGGRPILWHIMKLYSHYGFYRFIICLGYKGEMIKEYFLQYHLQGVDCTINTQTGVVTAHQQNEEAWEVTLVTTGLTNQTGSRVFQVAPYIDTDTFLLTYGDGVSNVDIEALLDFHHSHRRLATLTSVHPISRFGNLRLDNGEVLSFREKKALEVEWINGGFFIFNKAVFDYFSSHAEAVLEHDVLPSLTKNKQLMAYQHEGFWYCMDTVRDQEHLEGLWQTQNAPWKVWEDERKFTGAVKDTRPTAFRVSGSDVILP